MCRQSRAKTPIRSGRPLCRRSGPFRRVRGAGRPGYCKLTDCRGRIRLAEAAPRRGRHPVAAEPRRQAVSLPDGSNAVTRQPGLPRSSQISPRAMCEAPWSRKMLGDQAGAFAAAGLGSADNFDVQPPLRAPNAVDRIEEKRQRAGFALASQRGQPRRMADQAGGGDENGAFLDFAQAIVLQRDAGACQVDDDVGDSQARMQLQSAFGIQPTGSNRSRAGENTGVRAQGIWSRRGTCGPTL